jgi:enoyl-CoA hydratase/carnithine racemase
MNALTVAMYAEMAGALEHAAGAPDVRVVLIHGHPAVITGGDDLADRMNMAPGSGDRPVLRLLGAISCAPRPIVAAVNGPRWGVGTTMLLHCDLVYASEATRFHRLWR